MFITLIVFMLILGILVFVHELGHFLLAKKAGVLVEEFAFGFRPRLWGRKIGETTYVINLIPLGGYVKMFGENDDQSGNRAFRSKSIGQRSVILVAGSAMNLALGYSILIVLFVVGFDPLMTGTAKNPFATSHPQVSIGAVAPGSPAESAGLKAGETVLAINGDPVATDAEFIFKVNQHRGELITLTTQLGETEQQAKLTPRVNPPSGQGALGVVVSSKGKVRSNVIGAPAAALYETGHIIGLSVVGFAGFVRDLVAKGQVSENVTGVIGIGALTGVTRRLGIEYLAQLLLIVSIGLGVINLVPILPLDGGHIAALGYEKIAGRPLSPRQFSFLATVGLTLVLVAFLAVTYKDFTRFAVVERLFNAL